MGAAAESGESPTSDAGTADDDVVHRALQPEPTMQPEQPIYVDPASGRRYGVDPSTGGTYWLADADVPAPGASTTGQPTTGQPTTVDAFWPDLESEPPFPAPPGHRSSSSAHGRSGRASTRKLLLITGGSVAVLLVAVGAVGSLISPSSGPSTRAGSPLAAGGSATGERATGQPTEGPSVTEQPVTPATTPTATPTTAARTSTAPTLHSATSPHPTATAPKTTAPIGPKPPAVQVFANCRQLNAVYPHGVGLPGAVDHTRGKPVTDFTVNRSVYNANAGRDRDGDGIACEKA
jgi:hypothetical protein